MPPFALASCKGLPDQAAPVCHHFPLVELARNSSKVKRRASGKESPRFLAKPFKNFRIASSVEAADPVPDEPGSALIRLFFKLFKVSIINFVRELLLEISKAKVKWDFDVPQAC